MARVLVIDDDPLYLDMVVQALTEDGHDVQRAENGLEGIDKVRAYRPELVISDVIMDGADGYQVLATLRGEPSLAAIPFIMMTGWSSSGGQRQGMNMGADDYLPKPFSSAELLESVKAQLRRKEQVQSPVTERSTVSEVATNVLLPAEISRSIQTLHALAAALSREENPPSPEDVRQMGAVLGAAAWRIQRSVDNFVLYVQLIRLEQDPHGRRMLSQAPALDSLPFLTDRADRLASAHRRHRDLHLKLKAGRISMGPEYLGRILDELLENALTYSEPGTPIEVVSAFAPERFGLAITDHGRGMNEQQIARTEAHVQDGQMDPHREGLGLGLAIVRSIATLHGGSLSIKNKPGEKTRVSVEIPLHAWAGVAKPTATR
jgi:two-component system sensor histidine kinase/response regulator